MSVAYGDDKLVRGAEVLELYEDAGWTLLGSRSPTDVEESVRQSTVFITARDGARLVGFIGALSDRTYYAHITELVVRRSYQGRGIGAELLRRSLEALAQERVISIFAEPDADRFYRGFGFVPLAGGMTLRRS